ncbi:MULTISPECIES: hypothetical protein [unclassified Variovorax]|jgi:hypothetical protein|nr:MULTISPECIES: hypothetical protein [unclassified Variovorax]
MTQSFRQASSEVLPLSGMDLDVRQVELLLYLRRLLLFLSRFRGY